MSIEIKGIETKPEHDPYVNIDGVVSHTIFWLDPRDNTCGVAQEYQSNSTTMDRWHSRELCWLVVGHPSENEMREWIQENMEVLEEICAGHSVEWNGNNMVGIMTKRAQDLSDQIEQELESGTGFVNFYSSWTVESWIGQSQGEIKAGMTDEELKDLAELWEPFGTDVLVGRKTILEYITDLRDNLRFEEETI